jgi:hypothetical protein
MIKLNLVYDLLQTTKITSSTADVKREKRTDRIYFVICNSCYWCATYFGNDVSLSSSPLVCHVCDSNNTELMPISTDESFRIEYNPIRGLEIEFYR